MILGGIVIRKSQALKITEWTALVIIIIALIGSVLTYFGGTPWGKNNAQQKVLSYIKTKYHWSNPPIISPVTWDFKDRQYEMGVSFPPSLSKEYFFSVKDNLVKWYVTLPANGSADTNFNANESPPMNKPN